MPRNRASLLISVWVAAVGLHAAADPTSGTRRLQKGSTWDPSKCETFNLYSCGTGSGEFVCTTSPCDRQSPPPPPPPTYGWEMSAFAPCAEACGPRAAAARLAATVCAGTTVLGGEKFVASSPGLCTDAVPTATRACATLPADSPCDDGNDETMADACATVELGLYPIVTFQYSSTTLYQISYHIQYLFF